MRGPTRDHAMTGRPHPSPALRALLGPALALLLAGAAPSRADEPLPAPAQTRVAAPGGAFVALTDPDAPAIRVAPAGDEAETLWSVAAWRRAPLLAPDGRAMLLPPPGETLLDGDDPDQTVLTLVAAPGEVAREITLRDLGGPGILERTASHWRWTDGVAWDGDGWTVRLATGGSVRIGTDGAVASAP